MKKKVKFMAALSALLIIAGCFPTFTVKADTLTDPSSEQKNTTLSQAAPSPFPAEATQESSASPEISCSPLPAETTQESSALPEISCSPLPAETTQESSALPETSCSPFPAETAQESSASPEISCSPLPAETAQESSALPEAASSPSPETAALQAPNDSEQETDKSIPDEPPAFLAKIEYNFQGYVVMGTFTEFPTDTCLIQPVCSIDGENWEICNVEWNLQWLGSEDAAAISKLQTQICLYPSFEPLKSYLAGTLDRFYVKLRITRKNGATYDSQAAFIERSSAPCPISEDAELSAIFSSEIRVLERNPFRCYGKYQLTVNENASPEDIQKLLPDTLPVEIQITKDNLPSIGTVNCPVTWKPLSLSSLTAGESVTITDAAEKIIIPAGTLVNTPTGIFELHDPLPLDDGIVTTDEVRLVLNVVPENRKITGGLIADQAGLEIFFNLKPTGASNIRIYTLSEGAAEWTELSDSSIAHTINSHLSSPNGYYALILRNDQEPYCSYLSAVNAGETAVPFLVGISIEGGVYDKCQLILPWPETYEGPLRVPIPGAGSGGNENNAGSGNKKNSTAEGQRPDLPKNSAEDQESSGISDSLTEIKITHENQYDPAKEYIPDKITVPTPPVTQMQGAAAPAADGYTEKISPASAPALSGESGTQMNAATATLSPEQNTSAVSASSIEKEKTDSRMGISHKAVLPLFLTSIAGSIGIAAFGKLTAIRITGKSGK